MRNSLHIVTHLLAVAALGAVAAGCGGKKSDSSESSTTTAPITVGGAPTSELLLVSGGNQTATAGDQFAQPIRVMAQDSQGNPLANVQVLFQPTVDALGQGSLEFQIATPSVTTGDDGMAETFVTAGTVAGGNHVRVMAPELAGSSNLLVPNFATPAAATALVLESGDTQAAVAGANFGSPLVVAVTDQFGNAVPDTQVTFAVATGEAIVLTPSTVTDAGGLAQTLITAGQAAQPVTITATVAGIAAPITFTLNITPGPASQLVIVSGDAQSGIAGSALPAACVIGVRDPFGNAIADSTVTFAAATGGGSVTPASAMTNAQGQAQTALTLGTTLGANTVTATVTGLTPVTFTAMATGLTFTADVQPILNSRCTLCHAPGGVMAVRPFQTYAQVRDGISLLGMPYVIPNDPTNSIFVQKISAGGSMAGYLTAAQATTIRDWVNTGALEGAPQTATTLAKDSGDLQTAPANTPLAQPLIVKVTDANNLPVAFEELVWTVTAGGGSLAVSNGGATDLLGQAMATLTLGPTAGGTNTVTVTAPGINNATVTFTATAQAGANTSVLEGSSNPLDIAALANFKANNLISAPLSSDDEFIRRVTSDLIGRLPSASELTAWEADQSAGKRAALIDSLLASPEFLDHWTNIVAVWCETDPTESETINNVSVSYAFDATLRQDLSQGATINDILTKLITSSGDLGNAFRVDNSGNNLSSGTDVLATAFLGMSVHCGRCHDHKLTTTADDPRWTQSETYGLYAYMSNSSRYGNPRWVADGTGNQVTGPAYASDNLDVRRAALASTWTQSPAYHRATAHRIWAEIASPLLNVNEFLAANLSAVKNQQLLTALGDTFAAQNTSLQGFLRVALNSKLYQLSSAHTTTAGDANQARYQLRRNHAEVLERGIHQIADVVYRSDSIFRANFYAAERDSINTRDGDATSIDQALMLLNSSRARAITDSGNQIATLANSVNGNAMTYEEAVTVLVRAALSRNPTAAELAAIVAERDPGNTRASLEDVAVGVATSAEFVFRR